MDNLKSLLLNSRAKYGDLYNLAGDHNKRLRQAIMLEVTGEKRPISKCGITVLINEIYTALGIVDGCTANKDKQFSAWLKG